MSDIVIRVENLTKEYRLGVINHGTLHRDLQSWWARMRGKEDPNSLISASKHLTFNNSPFTDSDNPHLLAIDDVSFDVKQGEILGIIGRNGAGKSTLLKVLSRVTAPTSGSVKIKGRVASLLEVGTGFHPELTGRENVFLNGAIMGMTKEEINKKFDEIVDFAEVEKFIDTPVKRYSSGMYVRLAFAVAAHLEPEILIVDEVLAVGDAMFREKCLGKMQDVASEGRTVLFVSHQLKAVEMLCDRVILLEEGRLMREGGASEIIEHYLGKSGEGECVAEKADLRFADNAGKPAKITRLRIFNSSGELSTRHRLSDPIKIVVDFELRVSFPTLFVECVFRREAGFTESYGHGVFLTTSADWENYERGENNDELVTVFPMEAGKHIATINLSAPLLNAGIYEMELYLTTGPVRQDTCDKVLFEIEDDKGFASALRCANRSGFLAYPIRWDIERSQEGHEYAG